MSKGVPRIWTLKEKAQGLPILSAEIMDSVCNLRGALPQGENKLPWYTFCNEAMLAMTGLVYGNVFSSKDKGKPSTWVYFDDMLMEASLCSLGCPSLRRPNLPFEVPNLEVTSESPWGARKFHFHLAKPLLSKEMAAQYTPLVDPYAAFAQAMKHINQAVNGAFVLARRADHLLLDNSSLRYKVEGMKNAISFKNNLNKEPDKEYKDQKAKFEEEARRIVKLTENLPQEEVAAKARSVERVQLERAKVDEAVKASEALAQVKRDAEAALVSAATKADADRINFANSTLRSFIYSPAYEKKVGRECAAYLHSLVFSTRGRFPDLVALFNGEIICRPD
ncbi:hypothetical protein LIER_19972 [Lithospermum erythrorhizon]|uniref:Uncharacterized protein n=1 Tax=Lithospermum erythrorhizon TaxID=34254 RepID=A0AAV3QKN7_LITER